MLIDFKLDWFPVVRLGAKYDDRTEAITGARSNVPVVWIESHDGLRAETLQSHLVQGLGVGQGSTVRRLTIKPHGVSGLDAGHVARDERLRIEPIGPQARFSPTLGENHIDPSRKRASMYA
jgi:hypothetical protein